MRAADRACQRLSVELPSLDPINQAQPCRRTAARTTPDRDARTRGRRTVSERDLGTRTSTRRRGPPPSAAHRRLRDLPPGVQRRERQRRSPTTHAFSQRRPNSTRTSQTQPRDTKSPAIWLHHLRTAQPGRTLEPVAPAGRGVGAGAFRIEPDRASHRRRAVAERCPTGSRPQHSRTDGTHSATAACSRRCTSPGVPDVSVIQPDRDRACRSSGRPVPDPSALAKGSTRKQFTYVDLTNRASPVTVTGEGWRDHPQPEVGGRVVGRTVRLHRVLVRATTATATGASAQHDGQVWSYDPGRSAPARSRCSSRLNPDPQARPPTSPTDPTTSR